MNSGLILLNKKTGITSFQALGEIKRALGSGKVGHTGTLDKFACGLLVVLTGKALKLSQWFTHLDKQYLGRLRFGIETDTLDPEGKIIAEAEIPSREKVEQALKQFTGSIMQAPPAYSAIHVNGKRASDLARAGAEVEMKKRPINIYALELRSWQPPFAEIFVHCSSGAYIRSLARDIALAADSRAHLVELTRTQVGGFSLAAATEQEAAFLRPIDKAAIAALGLLRFEVSPPEAEAILHGKPLEPIFEGKTLFFDAAASGPDKAAQDCAAAVFSGETLAAIVEKESGRWKYSCVL